MPEFKSSTSQDDQCYQLQATNHIRGIVVQREHWLRAGAFSTAIMHFRRRQFSTRHLEDACGQLCRRVDRERIFDAVNFSKLEHDRPA